MGIPAYEINPKTGVRVSYSQILIYMNTLWTFGCSYSADYHPLYSGDEQLSNYGKYKEWRGGNLPKTWPELLSEKLNLNLQNKAEGGSSNYRIFTQFTDVVDEIKEGDIVIFGWTSVVRFIIADEIIEKFRNVLPSNLDNPVYDLSISREALSEILINRTNKVWDKEVSGWIKLINLYLGKDKVKVFHWRSTDSSIFDGMDGNFIDNELMFHIQSTTLYSTIKDETNNEVDDGHFGEYGQKAQSDYFYQFIVDKLGHNDGYNQH